jgi:hypothetical protein
VLNRKRGKLLLLVYGIPKCMGNSRESTEKHLQSILALLPTMAY